MGGCASKPKVLKEAKMEAAAPLVEEKVSKVDYGEEKVVEKVVVEVTKENEAGEEKQPKSLGNLFKESEEVEECELGKEEEQIPTKATKEIHEVIDSSETKDRETALDAKNTGEKHELTSEKPEVVAAPSAPPKLELLSESKAEEAGTLLTEVLGALEPTKTEGPGTIVGEEEKTASIEREKAESNNEPKQEFVAVKVVEKLEVPIKKVEQEEASVTLPCEEEPNDAKMAPTEVEVVKEVENPQDHPVVAKELEEEASKEVTESEKKEEVPLNEKAPAA